MAMLTDTKVRALKPKSERYEVFEGGGFGLRVTPSGTKTWIWLYRFEGKLRRMTLGKYPGVGVADARSKYTDALKALEKDIDPAKVAMDARDEQRRAPTVEGMIQEYLQRYASKKKASWEEDERILEKDVIPVIGHLKAKDVRRRDIIPVLDRVMDRGAPVAANRTGALLSRVFNFAIDRGIVDASPCVRLPREKEVPRERVLTDDEISAFWKNLDRADMSERLRIALKLVLVTGQRPGEVAGMALDEVDGDMWTIPAGRLKTRNKVPADHRVPLGSLAQALIESAKVAPLRNSVRGQRRRTKDSERLDSPFLFPSPARDAAINEKSLSRALRRNFAPLKVDPFTPHDLRRTVRTKLAELGISEVIAERVIGHQLQGMARVYNQHPYEIEKRKALETWERRLCAIVGIAPDENVVHLTQAGVTA